MNGIDVACLGERIHRWHENYDSGHGLDDIAMTVKSATISCMIRCGSLPAIPVIQSAITMAPRR